MGNGQGKPESEIRNVYVIIDDLPLTLTFSRDCPSQDIKDCLATVMGVSRWTSIAMKTQDGTYVAIEPEMPLNTPRNPYVIDAAQTRSGEANVLKSMLTQIAGTVISKITAAQLKIEVEARVKVIEEQLEDKSVKLMELQQLQQEMSKIKEQMRQDRITRRAIQNHKTKSKSKIKVPRSVASYPKYNLDLETLQLLKKPSFNVWRWESNEMLPILEHMYHSLDLVNEFQINPTVLRSFLMCVQANYRNTPFHNFRHCFCVTQMMYSIIHLCNLKDVLSSFDILILMTACLCHDLDHPGCNNAYQINAKTEIAIRYNDISPLENHHAATAFDILSQPEYNIFANLTKEEFKKIRQEMITLIFATDMARHIDIFDNFKSKLDYFDFKNEEYLNSLKTILIKCCDISNEVRPMEVSEPWVDCLLEEYFMQSDREKSEGLPVAPFMDRDKITKPTAQIGFIKFVLIPLFESLSKLFPQIVPVMVKPLHEAYDHYENKKTEEELLRREMSDKRSASDTASRTRSRRQQSESGSMRFSHPAKEFQETAKETSEQEAEKQGKEASEKID